jgi:hypothetical protein
MKKSCSGGRVKPVASASSTDIGRWFSAAIMPFEPSTSMRWS